MDEITSRGIAGLIGVHFNTFSAVYKHISDFPDPVRRSGNIRYWKIDDINEWLAKHPEAKSEVKAIYSRLKWDFDFNNSATVRIRRMSLAFLAGKYAPI